MIIVCPACGRRYRIDRSRLEAGVRLRCSGCRQVFDSRRPAPTAGSRAAPAAAAPAAPPPSAPSASGDGRPLVLIGDVNRQFRSAAQRALETLGCRVETSEQGAALFRAAVNRRPVLLLLNTRLPGLSGTAVCEGVKGSPHLRSIKVVLVSSTIHPPTAGEAVRAGFEPDDHLEDTIDERELQIRLAHQLGHATEEPARQPGGPVPIQAAPRPPSPVDNASSAPPERGPVAPAGKSVAPAARAREAGPPVAVPEPPRRAAAKVIDPRDALDPAAEIQRLARIMLSDLKLYNPDRFASAVHDGRLLETFRGELLRGKDLISTRFPDLPDRMALLTAALRQGIEEEQSAAGGG